MKRIAILAGPTATGKSELAFQFARDHGALELVNADSMIVYRGMDIGTAKPDTLERSRITHHLIDIRDADQPFTAGEFYRECGAAIADIHSRGKRALIVGGTGFYLKALLFGLWDAPASDPALRAELEKGSNDELFQALKTADPASALRIGPNDRYRLLRAIETYRLSGKTPTELQEAHPRTPDPQYALLVLDRSNEELDDRIGKRAGTMLQAGLVEEVRRLRERYPASRALGAVGYSQVCCHLDGILPKGRLLKPGVEGLQSEIALATRQMVKNQRTFFRGLKCGESFTLEADREKLRGRLREIYEH